MLIGTRVDSGEARTVNPGAVSSFAMPVVWQAVRELRPVGSSRSLILDRAERLHCNPRRRCHSRLWLRPSQKLRPAFLRFRHLARSLRFQHREGAQSLVLRPSRLARHVLSYLKRTNRWITRSNGLSEEGVNRRRQGYRRSLPQPAWRCYVNRCSRKGPPDIGPRDG